MSLYFGKAINPLLNWVLELKVTCNPRLSLVPFFVEIIIAPFFPWKPYNAAALGPFKTVNVSISSGLRLYVSELMGTPSTTNKGRLFGLFSPRIITSGACPISELIFTASPAALPFNELIGSASRAFVSAAASIV